jgi:hypothetical protein
MLGTRPDHIEEKCPQVDDIQFKKVLLYIDTGKKEGTGAVEI